jgi:hypothetical protein
VGFLLFISFKLFLTSHSVVIADINVDVIVKSKELLNL